MIVDVLATFCSLQLTVLVLSSGRNSFLIVRIETYLGNVVGIQPGKKKDTTSGRYLIPVNKLDECMTYIQ